MKLKELKSIIIADEVVIFVHGTTQRFCNVNNVFVFWNDNNVSLWDVYGGDDVDKIYMDYTGSNIDNEVICIDLK